jgi:protein O-GlcNAc transferase
MLQVALMQQYTVLIGMNGAGLTNGLYLPPGGVVIQLVPSGIQLNSREFGQLLQGGAGGGYLEWVNRLENGTINGSGDTYVDVGEVVELVRKAVAAYETSHRRVSDEF